jgi:hypothetical protein
MREESIERKYEKAFSQASAVNPVFPYAAKQQMAKMVEICATGNKHIDLRLQTDQSAAIKGGYIAEEFHAETFNLDATLKGDGTRALTDQYEAWGEHEWNGQLLTKNDRPDIILSKDGKVISSSQLKYNDIPETTAAQMSQTHEGKPKYQDVDHLIGPSDQINPSGDVVSVGEHAEAAAEGNQARGGDPAKTEAYRQTAKKNTDVVKNDKSSSTALSKAEADKMGTGDKSKLTDIENSYKTKSTLQQMGNAAAGAAAMSAVVSGSVNTVCYIQLACEGKLTAEEATLKIVGETVSSAADSAVKAGANAGVQSLMVRYGSEKAVVETLAKQGLKSMLKTNVVTVGVTCAVDAVKDIVRLGMGDISREEFFEKQGKGLLTTSAGVAGGACGAAGAATIAGSFGLGSGTLMTAVELVGGLSGGLIAGLAMTLAIENAIEKPYRDLVRNTSNLHSALTELERVSQTMVMGQMFFTKYLEADIQLESRMDEQFKRIDAAGERALDIINQI